MLGLFCKSSTKIRDSVYIQLWFLQIYTYIYKYRHICIHIHIIVYIRVYVYVFRSMEKRIILVTVIVTIVTVVGKRKTEDTGVRERQSEREGTRK